MEHFSQSSQMESGSDMSKNLAERMAEGWSGNILLKSCVQNAASLLSRALRVTRSRNSTSALMGVRLSFLWVKIILDGLVDITLLAAISMSDATNTRALNLDILRSTFLLLKKLLEGASVRTKLFITLTRINQITTQTIWMLCPAGNTHQPISLSMVY